MPASQLQHSPSADVFQKKTLPELSPMSYSLTATYPFHPDTNDQSLYLDTMAASSVSLRQPTMFAISLQNEESKSAQGSRLSMPGSKTSSIHGSRPSMYGSRASGLYGSRPIVFNSGNSRESLLGVRGSKDHSVEEEGVPTMNVGRMLSTSATLPNSSTDNMEAPTRDSPLRSPLTSATSISKKDFASLTCILDYSRGGSISPSSPSPPESAEHTEQEGPSPMHHTSGRRRDLGLLTSLDVGQVVGRGLATGVAKEDSSKTSNVALDKVSPAVKQTCSKTMSRLEKLTSLDYIRQSFRIKKKVSFEPAPESMPKKGSHKGNPSYDMVFTNESAQNQDSRSAAPEEEGEGLEWRKYCHASSTSTEMFSPTEMSRTMFLQQQRQHPFADPHSMGGGCYVPQLSQPYYLPPHAGGVGPGVAHVYPHPQLSQSYYSQLSQNYSFLSPYHIPIGDPFYGIAREGLGDGTMRGDLHYHEILTPDYSDATTPEHEHFVAGGRAKRINSDDYDPRGIHVCVETPDKFMETGTTSDFPMSPSQDASATGMYRDGHSNGFINNNYLREELDLMENPQKLGVGYMGEGRRGYLDALHEGPGGEEGLGRYLYHHTPMSHIPEDVHMNSISVDDPLHYSGSSHPHSSNYSESSEDRDAEAPAASKGRVSWNSTLTTYPPEKKLSPRSPDQECDLTAL